MSNYVPLKGLSYPGQSLVTDQLETNLCHYVQWGLVDIGGFLNVTLSQQGGFGGDMSRLSPVSDPRVDSGTTGRIWQGVRKEWVYETGLSCQRQPIRVSGVYVNGTFHSLAETGVYAHSIDYQNGRVIFDAPISPSSVVQAEYSLRLYSVSTADVPWFRQIQPDSFRVDDPAFLTSGSGAWSRLTEQRIQLPHVVVQGPPKMRLAYGMELGDNAVWTHQDYLFHVFADTRPDMKFLHDVLTNQQDSLIWTYDKNQALLNDRMPLDQNGALAVSGLLYPAMLDTFPWKRVQFKSFASHPVLDNGPLYVTTVRATVEVGLP